MKQNMVDSLRKKYPKGTKIHIEFMEGEPQYANKDGIVEYVDEKEDLEELPDSMDIPQGMDEDEIDDYLSDQTGFCHDEFDLEER